MKNIEKDIYELLKKIAKKRDENFSGIGIVVYNKNELSHKCYCDLRPNFKLEPISIHNDKIVEKLLEYSDYRNNLHDGFCFMEENEILTHVAQYYVPPAIEEIIPNQKHGVRTYSAACGSTMKGVRCIALVSSNNDILIYKDGKELLNDNEYVINK